MEAGFQLLVRDRLSFEVLGEDLVVGFGRCLQQLVPPQRHLIDQVLRDGHLVTGAVLVDPGAAMDHVDVPPEPVPLADGHLEGRDLAAELGAQGVHGSHRVSVLPVATGHHEEGRASQRAALCDRVLGARPDGRASVRGDQRTIHGAERGDELTHEVGVARCVDDGDPMVRVLECRHRERQRELALLLLGLPVEAGGPVVDTSGTGDGARRVEHVLRQ